ncbi:VOC family protein [Actinocorallia populi]|uniref:VOC family protein n=1 Tax=Actinocorallia populi TaxID=2079200 RepID=UPI000D0879F9|nr:VOC family protein [Actinocorallia populi]
MITSLGYLRFETADLGAWRTFGSEVLGLEAVTGPDENALYFRHDEYANRFTFLPGEADRLLAAGWEVANARALAETVERLEKAGRTVTPGTAEEAADRRVEALVHVDDPNGNHLEIYHSPAMNHAPQVNPYGNRFVAGGLGLGHIVLSAPDIEASFAFYTELLGFRHRDSLRFPAATFGGPEGRMNWVRFLGANPRHHSLGLCEAPLPAMIFHFMLELSSLDEVGRGLDRFHKAGYAVQQSLGRHTNDKMVSFYAATPGPFQVEYGYDAVLVDDATWTVKEITEDAYWGHQ